MTPSTTLGSPPRSPVLPASPVERCRGRPHARPSPLELRRDGKEPADRKPGTRARQHHPARAISMPRGPPPAPQPRPQQKTTAHHADIPSPAAHPAPLDNILLRWWLPRPGTGPGVWPVMRGWPVMPVMRAAAARSPAGRCRSLARRAGYTSRSGGRTARRDRDPTMRKRPTASERGRASPVPSPRRNPGRDSGAGQRAW
jgi:hypothetical protein